MALVLADRVRETTTVVGTGTATLLGAVTGYQSFTAVGNANTTYYVIASQAANQWEVGIGTYTASGTTLSRDTVLSSSNAGALVNFTAGTKDIWVDYAAGRAVYENEAGNVDGFPITGGSINNTVIGNTTPNAATFTTLTATGQTSLGGAAGAETVRVNTGTNTGKYTLFEANTANNVQLIGAPNSANLGLYSTGGGLVRFYTAAALQEQQFAIGRTASAVNFAQITGGATGAAPTLSAQGSDTNISLNLTSKGTGAINLQTGNGTVLQAIDRGGAQDSPFIFRAGLAGTQGGRLTLPVATTITAADASLISFATNSGVEQFRVSNTASAVNFVQVTGAATGAAPVISSQGSDTNVPLSFLAKGAASVGLANSAAAGAFGIELAENTTVDKTIFIDFHASASTDFDLRLSRNPGVNGNAVYQNAGTGSHILYTATNSNQFTVAHTASAVNFVQVTGNTTSNTPIISAQGSDANIGLAYITKGTGSHFLYGPSLPAFQVNSQAANANYGIFTSTSTGISPLLQVAGTDANIDFRFRTQGTGLYQFDTGSNANTQFRVASTVSAVNYVQVTGAATGSGAVISTQGSDTNVNLLVNPKGTGNVGIGTGAVQPSAPLEVRRDQNATTEISLYNATSVTAPTVNVRYMLRNSTSGGPTGGGAYLGLQSNNLRLWNEFGNSIIVATNGTQMFRFLSNASVVNNFDVQGAATTQTPVFSVSGSDTNIAQVFQSKGTGAINLAPGSSGVNISNGGTVTAITRTAAGSAYTTIPALAISAPTTAGGVQATAAVTAMVVNTVAVSSGGTGYTAGDVLTVSDGTVAPAQLSTQVTVSTVSAGVITAVTVSRFGTYSVLPTNPASVTGGTGSGATFNFTYAISGASTNFTITNAGSGYVEQPTVTFSGGGGSGAAAYASVGSGTIIRSLGGSGNAAQSMSFVTPSGESFRVATSTTGNTSANYLQAASGSTGNGVSLSSQGSDSNIWMILATKGTGNIQLLTNAGQEQLRVAHTASAVNYVQVTGSATGGNGPVISSQGSDANVNATIQTKGSGVFRVVANNAEQFRVNAVGSAANIIQVSGAASGSAPSVRAIALGGDTNVPLVLQPLGTGALQAQLNDGTATGGNARGANAVDWQMSRASASQVASGSTSFVGGGRNNTASNQDAFVGAGFQNVSSSIQATIAGGARNSVNSDFGFIGSGLLNSASGQPYASIVGGQSNTAAGYYNFIGGGFTNSGTASAAVTTQSATMNGTTAVTLSGSNASIRVGQIIIGTSIAGDTYVAAISGTSLTLSKVASGSSTSTLSFFTPHGVVVGGGNNQATGAYSFIGGGGDAGTASARNVASGDWSFVGGGKGNTASGIGAVVVGGGVGANNSVFVNTSSGFSSFVGGGIGHTASNAYSTVLGGAFNLAAGISGIVVAGRYATDRGITGNTVLNSGYNPMSGLGTSQSVVITLARETTNATPTVLCSDANAASTVNQVILPNNSAYTFRGEVVSGVTGGGNSKSWTIEGLIKRGANAAATTLVGSTVTSMYADVGAATWTIALSADTTNGGLAVTFTGQAGTTIRTVARINTVEMTF